MMLVQTGKLNRFWERLSCLAVDVPDDLIGVSVPSSRTHERVAERFAVLKPVPAQRCCLGFSKRGQRIVARAEKRCLRVPNKRQMSHAVSVLELEPSVCRVGDSRMILVF
jgi:hypothetical protein